MANRKNIIFPQLFLHEIGQGNQPAGHKQQQDGRALEHAGEGMKNDATIVRAAVQRNGWALKEAGEVMKADPEIVLAAFGSGSSKEGWDEDNCNWILDNWGIAETVKQNERVRRMAGLSAMGAKSGWLLSTVWLAR